MGLSKNPCFRIEYCILNIKMAITVLFTYDRCIFFQDLLKILLKHGVDVNKSLSASKGKLSPLMIAASKGNLEMVRLLVQNGAVIEQLGEKIAYKLEFMIVV